MKLVHTVMGALVLVAFLLTGQYMDYLDVRSGGLGDVMHMMYRSRHIYLLLAGPVNLCVGAYFIRRAGGWRKALQMSGSILILQRRSHGCDPTAAAAGSACIPARLERAARIRFSINLNLDV